MKNVSSNTAIAPVTTLPESVRIPLHSLQADLEYLIGRVIADGSCGSMIVKSMRDRLDQVEAALTLREPQASAASEPAGWLVERPGDSTFPRLFRNKASADALVEYVNVNPPAISRPVFLNEPQEVQVTEALIAEYADRCFDPRFGSEGASYPTVRQAMIDLALSLTRPELCGGES